MSINNLQITYQGCPLCKKSSIFLGEVDCTGYSQWHEPLPKKLEWMRCTQCQHVHTRYFWSQAGLDEIFRNSHANQTATISQYPDAKRAIWIPSIEKVISLLGGYRQALGCKDKVPVWLDVGCGDGALTMTASDFGFMALGLDARAETVARIQNLGFQAQQGNFMDVQFEGQADVISMMDVLEHMPYPREALEKAAKILRSGGVIVISLPDLSCSSWKIMDAANINPYWMEIEHHHNFSRQRLINILQECGFDPSGFSIPHRYKAQMEIYAVKI